MADAETDVRLTTEEAVTAGGVFLDENYPGWRDRVAPDKLDMFDSRKCPLAQASGKLFVEAIHFHNILRSRTLINLGFDMPSGSTRLTSDNLRDEWVSQHFS